MVCVSVGILKLFIGPSQTSKKGLYNSIDELDILEASSNLQKSEDDGNILNTQIGIKQKNYQLSKSKVYLQSSITNAKDLFKENYPDEKIMHIIIDNYLIDGKNYFYLQDNLEYEQLNLVIQFKYISNEIVYNLNKILQNL